MRQSTSTARGQGLTRFYAWLATAFVLMLPAPSALASFTCNTPQLWQNWSFSGASGGTPSWQACINSKNYNSAGDSAGLRALVAQCDGTYYDTGSINILSETFTAEQDSEAGAPNPAYAAYVTVGIHKVGGTDDQTALSWSNVCVNPQFYVSVAIDNKNLAKPFCAACVGNPVNPANGNKYQTEVDYVGPGDFPLTFSRYFNSQDRRVSRFGRGWRHFFARALSNVYDSAPGYASGNPDYSSLYGSADLACVQGWQQIRSRAPGLATTTASYANGTCTLSEGATVRGTLAVYSSPGSASSKPALVAINADREDGSSLRFTVSGSTYTPDPGVTATLEQIANGYRLTKDDIVEEYDSNGRLLLLRNRTGVQQTLSYDGQGRLSSVTDSFGRSISIGFNAADKFGTLTDPDGKQTSYTYNGNGDIETVTYPDGKVRRYHYESASFPRVITGITDENGDRFATWSYDDMGRASVSQHAGGAERVDLTFNSNGTTTVTDSLGTSRIYSFQYVNGIANAGTITESCAICGGASTATTYDANGFPASRTDLNGNVTNYVFNSRGLEISRTEAYGTSLARTITTLWDTTYRVPTQIDEPGRRTTFTYDASGNRLTRTVLDTNTSESRTTTWTYNALGQVLTVDGPRADVSDVTTYAYYGDTTASHHVGDLHTITNALNQVTEITAYDAHGNPLHIVDPNGVATDLTYDSRQRLKTRNVSGATTVFDYDGVGQVKKVTLPDASYMFYAFDAAHRLTDICDLVDNLDTCIGNRIHYTLDPLGNRTKEEIFDPTGSLKRTSSQVFDALGRLQQTKNAAGAVVTEFGYDAQGNRTSKIDHIDSSTTATTTYTPDALNRIITMLDPGLGSVAYGYNALDQLTSVTDQANLTTSYGYNAFGNVVQLVSPDTGTTNATFDAAGNRVWEKNADGGIVTFTYDALNRLTTRNGNGETFDQVAYYYDGSNYTSGVPNGIGRLTGALDVSGPHKYYYDNRGNLTEEDNVVWGGVSVASPNFKTSYAYDAADRLIGLTYPTGRVVTYQRDSTGHVVRVTATQGGSTITLADSVQYMPFGPQTSTLLGNGISSVGTYDLDYRISALSAGAVQNMSYDYDLRNDVTKITDTANPDRTQTFGYDALSRLTNAAGNYGSLGYTYDGVGNRLTETRNGTTTTYSYIPGTHQFYSAGWNPGDVYNHRGLLFYEHNRFFGYPKTANWPDVVTSSWDGVVHVLASYIYNAWNQRIVKTTYQPPSVPSGANSTYYVWPSKAPADTKLFHYDREGHIIAETCVDGRVVAEYAYMNGQPLVTWMRSYPNPTGSNADICLTSVGGAATTASSPLNTIPPSLASSIPVTPYAPYWYHTNHLGAPQKITDQAGIVVWDAVYEPFGNVSLKTEKIINNFRSPGQYADNDFQTGNILEPNAVYYYNWNRTYNPSIGRYVQSDPIGLNGGINTYAYVDDDPINWFDSNGEAKEHTKDARPSTKEKHEKGQARQKLDAGNEKGDEYRRPPRKRPPGYKGKWPRPKDLLGIEACLVPDPRDVCTEDPEACFMVEDPFAEYRDGN